MTSLVTAKYDASKNQILDPNSLVATATWDSTGTALMKPDGSGTAVLGAISQNFIGARNITGTRQGAVAITVDKTWSLCVALPVGFYGVRPIFGNDLTVPITGCKVAASVGGTASDLKNSAGTWINGTWGFGAGAALTSGSIPCDSTGGGTSNSFFSTPTDFIPIEDTARVDGGTFKLVYLRLLTPFNAGANPNIPTIGPGVSMTPWDAPTDGMIFAHRFMDGDFITTPSGFTGNANPSSSPICGVQFLSKTAVKTVLFSGDSITHGFGSTPAMNSFAHQSCVAQSTAAAPVVCANFGQNSIASTLIAARASQLISLLKPTTVVIPAGSPNDGTPTAATKALALTAQRSVLSACRANQVQKMVVWGELPRTTDATNATSSYTAPQDLFRKTLNRENSLTSITYIPMTAMQDSDADGVASKWVSASVTGDGLHPNAAGDTLMTPLFTGNL